MVGKKKVKFFEGFEFNNWLEAIGSAVLLVVVVGGITLGTLALLIGHNRHLYDYTDTVMYQVESGDTLWTIARQYTNHEKQDVRRVIDIIEDINDCTADIYPGDCLTIPVFDCCGGH